MLIIQRGGHQLLGIDRRAGREEKRKKYNTFHFTKFLHD
jgi:hypothetical protein